MSVTEDESRNLDAGWDDEPLESAPSQPGVDEAEVDEAWDSIAPSVPSANAASPSVPPQTEEVDSGWDDVAVGAPQPNGKRRPHRQRRTKASAVAVSASPVLLPRPAEPTKKHQRELARKKRAQEAQVKQQRKLERKQQRVLEARAQAAERVRQAEAEAEARRQRQEARDRARGERPAPSAKPTPARAKPAATKSTNPEREVAAKPVRASKAEPPAKRGLRPGVIITLLILVAVLALLLLNK